MRNILFTLLSAALFAACTQDELTDRRGEPLPEGQYPLELTASLFGAEAMPAGISTRATVTGIWDTGDKIYMQVASKDEYEEGLVNWTSIDILCYTVDSDGKSLTFDSGNSDGTQPYWTSTGDQKFIRAWYRGDGSSALPGDYSVQTNQSSGDNYEKSDFLYAHATIGFRDEKTLTFYHQLAKVVVNIRDKNISSEIAKVDARTYNKGTFTTPNTSSNYGSWNYNNKRVGVEMKRLSTPNSVVFEAEKEAEPAKASYEAILIPYTINKNIGIFNIVTSDNVQFEYVLNSDITWQPGHIYTYNLTLDNNGVIGISLVGVGNWTSGGSHDLTTE